MNLPTTYRVLQTIEEDKPLRRNYREYWGAKTEGIKPGEFVQGIFLGIEIAERGAENIVLKSFTHGGQQLLIFGCTSLKREFYSKEQKVQENPPISVFSEPLYQVGEVIQVTFVKSFEDKKFNKDPNKVVLIGQFKIDRCAGYNLTQEDILDINEYVASQVPKRPLNSYQPPRAQQQYAAPNQSTHYVLPAQSLTYPPQPMPQQYNPTYAAQPAVVKTYIQPQPTPYQTAGYAAAPQTYSAPQEQSVTPPIPANNSFEI